MRVLDFKAKGKTTQYTAIDEAIRTAQFVRNKCIRFWMDNKGVGQKELYRHNTLLRAQFPFVNALNSHACQVAVEWAYSSIARFYDNCRKSIPGKKGFDVSAQPNGYPKFKKNCRCVEYKTSGWKLSEDRRSINFIDKKGIGKLKLKGTWDLHYYQLDQIKRVRLVRRADGYYVQFLIRVEGEKVDIQPTGKIVGLDVGLSEFYTDSNGHTEPNPKFYRTGEKRLKFRQRRVSRKKKGSANRKKAINKLGRVHLKISGALTRTLRDWQREEHAKRVARCVIQSNDLVAYEDLRIKNLVKNHCLSLSINDAGWYQFRKWLEYFGVKFSKVTVAVTPAYTSQECSNCGTLVKKSLSMRTHVCKCSFVLDRDWNAAINILKLALSTTGHVGTWVKDPNASGDSTSTLVGAILLGQVESLSEESLRL
jgi:putative transposase